MLLRLRLGLASLHLQAVEPSQTQVDFFVRHVSTTIGIDIVEDVIELLLCDGCACALQDIHELNPIDRA